MKTTLAILITAAVTAGLAFGFRGMTGSTAAGPPAPVRIEPASRGDLIEFVTAPGKVEPKTKVAISARVSARIVSLPCEEGAEVERGSDDGSAPGSLLVKLDSKDLEAALQSAEANRNAQAAAIEVEKTQVEGRRFDLQGAEVDLAQKERELRRQEELLTTRDVSESTVEDLRSAVEKLRATIGSTRQSIASAEKNLVVLRHRLEAADADIIRAKDNLNYTTIYSPLDGVVTRIDSEVGELAIVGVTNSPGTTIMEVADMSRMILLAQVDEADVGGIREGQRARVRVQAYPGRVFHGTVTQVALTATELPGQTQSKHFEVEILLDTGGERIYSGLSADVDIEVEEHKGLLKVPSQSVLGRAVDVLPPDLQKHELVDKGKSMTAVVYRVRDGKAVATPVRIGASDGAYTVIEAGLEENEPVVVGPYKVLEGLAHNQDVVDDATITDEQRKAYYDRHATPVRFDR